MRLCGCVLERETEESDVYFYQQMGALHTWCVFLPAFGCCTAEINQKHHKTLELKFNEFYWNFIQTTFNTEKEKLDLDLAANEKTEKIFRERERES